MCNISKAGSSHGLDPVSAMFIIFPDPNVYQLPYLFRALVIRVNTYLVVYALT